jgi:RNA polymerase sporulation-specific sigma factor
MTYKNYNDYELMYLISENNEDAYQTIFEKYQPLVFKEAIKYIFLSKKLGISEEDLIEEGKVGLYKAIEGYNNEVEFFTFASICIKRSIFKLLKKSSTYKQKILNEAIDINQDNDDSIYYQEEKDKDIVQNLINEEFESKITKFKHKLNEQDSTIFELKYNGFTYKEISEILNLDKKYIDNRLLSIRNKLKKYLKDEK